METNARTGTRAAEATVLRCPACGAKNRVAAERLRQGPSCGRCRTTLLPRAVVPIRDADWTTEVDASPLPVLVDFWAPWCGPCRMMAPVLDELARDMAGRIKIAKLNVDENPAAAARFNVTAIPTLVLLDRGRLVEEMRGALPKEALRARLARLG